MSRADVVREKFRRVAEEGASNRDIVRWLDGAGVPGPGGKGWAYTYVSGMLQHPAYVGLQMVRDKGRRHRALLREAARTQDVVDALSVALEEHGPLAEGSKGQLRVSPIVGELRQQRLTLVRLLGALGIPEAEYEARPVTTTNRARKAAAVRWSARHG